MPFWTNRVQTHTLLTLTINERCWTDLVTLQTLLNYPQRVLFRYTSLCRDPGCDWSLCEAQRDAWLDSVLHGGLSSSFFTNQLFALCPAYCTCVFVNRILVCSMTWVFIRVCGLSAGRRSVSSPLSRQMETSFSWTITSALKSRNLHTTGCVTSNCIQIKDPWQPYLSSVWSWARIWRRENMWAGDQHQLATTTSLSGYARCCNSHSQSPPSCLVNVWTLTGCCHSDQFSVFTASVSWPFQCMWSRASVFLSRDLVVVWTSQ